MDKEKYELYDKGKKVANVDLIVTKSGSEAASLFAQKHIDLALLSITAAMTGIDSGMAVKVLAPLQTEGLALVFPKDNPLNGWEGFEKYLAAQKEPVKIGYHSPTSAPLMEPFSIMVSCTPRFCRCLMVDEKEYPLNWHCGQPCGYYDSILICDDTAAPAPYAKRGVFFLRLRLAFRQFRQGSQCGVDFLACIRMAEAEANRTVRKCPQRLVGRGSAVHSGTGHNAVVFV